MGKLSRLWRLGISAALSMAAALTFADDSNGTHGMALFSIKGQLIASHMPLHGKRHGHQVILALESENEKAIAELAQKTPLISLKPEVFSLNHLRNGDLGFFTGEVFNGHFERDGKVQLNSIPFRVAKKLLDLPLTRKENGHYRLVHLNSTSLLIHEIASPPSFDQILEVTADPSAPNTINTDSKHPISETHWPESLKEAGIVFRRQLYLEKQDFQ
ncbi:hypothetical protein [Microbulbifer sp. THAF38]|uniref:hypothetical protein n=1 Tax=Microbulbifer sp. THAF38 TaxID=2587856 RepID=UPI0012690406|nr:hypothetical protein [Microbulbifer sp. THAF38]QFT55660.1 hypothetical protein FIU95_14015 [Microbulbifer sp. THAF38]